ncbi:MAG: ABATE domain-containing protein [Armatimonadetes bacterium]|nr:ABATE domain-containing protein [Armatimonadota bacterium]
MPEKSSPPFAFLGGHLALDFANTVDRRASNDPKDGVASYSDLVAWATQAGIVNDPQAAYLEQAQAARLEEAAVALRMAWELREAIYRLVAARIAGQQPAAADIVVLNRVLREGLFRLKVAPAESTFALQWTPDDLLEWPLWSVAWTAAQLLVSRDLARAKQCASTDGCGRLFLDQSKNLSRRWCAMRDCGNLAKARKYRERKRRSVRRE